MKLGALGTQGNSFAQLLPKSPPVKGSAGARFAVLLPHVVSLVILRQRVSAKRLAGAAVRLGGIYGWAVEQAAFAEEIAGADIAGYYVSAKSPSSSIPDVPGFGVTEALPLAATGVGSYAVITEAGQQGRLLVSIPDHVQLLSADVMLIDRLVAVIAAELRHISRPGLVNLINCIAEIALIEADLSAEASGLRLGATSGWFAVPEIIREGDGFLLASRLPGVMFSLLPAAQSASAYHQATTAWAYMLLRDNILQVGLRRDQIVLDERGIGVARWAGTRSSPEMSIILRRLILSAFGSTSAIRKNSFEEVAELFSEFLGLAGDTDRAVHFSVSLVSGRIRLFPSDYRKLRMISFRQRADYRIQSRIDLILLLRQLIWIRDIGRACGVGDLASPWREVAIEIERDMPGLGDR